MSSTPQTDYPHWFTCAGSFLTAEVTGSRDHSPYLGGPPAVHAAIRGVQNFLVLPALFSGDREWCLALYRAGEGVNLSRISVAVRDGLGSHRDSVLPELDDDGVVDRQAIVRPQDALFANNFKRGAILGTG